MLKAVDDDLSQDKFLMAASSSSKGSAKYWRRTHLAFCRQPLNWRDHN
jgi:hypothetical protein